MSTRIGTAAASGVADRETCRRWSRRAHVALQPRRIANAASIASILVLTACSSYDDKLEEAHRQQSKCTANGGDYYECIKRYPLPDKSGDIGAWFREHAGIVVLAVGLIIAVVIVMGVIRDNAKAQAEQVEREREQERARAEQAAAEQARLQHEAAERAAAEEQARAEAAEHRRLVDEAKATIRVEDL
ncbi:hypothetical protein [Tsukamurella tyrosinosolvens]|uniref:hypothetical protein n=1 Tax=Tsukamurella tyrosinosolvens TaxID=57704 RepID=UPI002DD43A85|nr:hypothetical protein [Tsukamurella tyrosinosolvens]MEC4616441.1 hypothetical protein [Tsukamurella tyrosinosolvens]